MKPMMKRGVRIKGDIFCKKRVITYCLARVFPSTRCCSLCQEEEKKKVTDYDFECMNERVVGEKES